MAEAEGVAEFVSEDGFEVVTLRRGRERDGSGKCDLGVRGAEVDVGIENLAELGGGGAVESYRRELDVMTAALADPSVLLLRELLHACWGRRPRDDR